MYEVFEMVGMRSPVHLCTSPQVIEMSGILRIGMLQHFKHPMTSTLGFDMFGPLDMISNVFHTSNSSNKANS